MKSSIFAAVAYSALAEEGQKTVCLGPRAHLLTYKIEEGQGTTLATVDAADIEITRTAENDGACASNGESDDKLFCFGANADETCSNAGESIIFSENFECTSCWAGITADLYYSISTVLGVPTKAEVGVRNTKILGALSLHAHGDSATELITGSVDLFAPETHVNFVAGSIPLNFTFSLPTRIEYNLGLKGQLNAVGGASLNVDFGDHGVIATPTSHTWINTNYSAVLDPVFDVSSGDSGADMGLALAGSIHVEANDMISYHVDYSAGLPSKIILDDGYQLCFESDLDIPVNQEAEAYKYVLGRKVPLYHYGPEELTHIHQDQAVKKCSPLSAVVV